MMTFTVVLKAIGETGSTVIVLEDCPDVKSACEFAENQLETLFAASKWKVAAVFAGNHESLSGIPLHLQA